MTTNKPVGHHIHCAFQAFKQSHSIRGLCRELGKLRSYENIKNKFDPAKEGHRLNVYELVEFTLKTGDYTLINGVCKEVGLSNPTPRSFDSKANLNTEFLVLAKSVGEVAEHLNTSRLSANCVSKLSATINGLVASAMTIAYVAESRFGGVTTAVMFSDMASGVVI